VGWRRWGGGGSDCDYNDDNNNDSQDAGQIFEPIAPHLSIGL